MSLVPEVKCPRCDRKFSGLRGRCPYCGTRRRSKGKRVSASDNSFWKLLISAVLLLVLIIAVVVLIVSALGDNNAEQEDDTKDKYTADDGVQSVIGDEEDEEEPDTPDDPVTQEPEPVVPTVDAVRLEPSWGGELTKYNGDGYHYDVTMKAGDKLTLVCKILPEDCEETPIWETDNDSVIIVMQSGEITAVGKGSATLSVTVGNITIKALVRVK